MEWWLRVEVNPRTGQSDGRGAAGASQGRPMAWQDQWYPSLFFFVVFFYQKFKPTSSKTCTNGTAFKAAFSSVSSGWEICLFQLLSNFLGNQISVRPTELQPKATVGWSFAVRSSLRQWACLQLAPVRNWWNWYSGTAQDGTYSS